MRQLKPCTVFCVLALLAVLSGCATAVGNGNITVSCIGCQTIHVNVGKEAQKPQKYEDGISTNTDGDRRWRGLSTATIASAKASAVAQPMAEAVQPKAPAAAPKKTSVTRDKISASQDEPLWYPWSLRGVTQISREDLAAAFKVCDEKVLRVSVETFINRIGNLGIPSPQDQAKFAAWIAVSGYVKEVACTSKLLEGYYMSRASADGKTIDMEWTRKSCYKNEKFLAFVNVDGIKQPFLSLSCANILTPIKRRLRNP